MKLHVYTQKKEAGNIALRPSFAYSVLRVIADAFANEFLVNLLANCGQIIFK